MKPCSRRYLEEHLSRGVIVIYSDDVNPCGSFQVCFDSLKTAQRAKSVLDRARTHGRIDYSGCSVTEPGDNCPLTAVPEGTKAVLAVYPRKGIDGDRIEDFLEKLDCDFSWQKNNAGVYFARVYSGNPRALAEDARARKFTVTFNLNKKEVYFWLVDYR